MEASCNDIPLVDIPPASTAADEVPASSILATAGNNSPAAQTSSPDCRYPIIASPDSTPNCTHLASPDSTPDGASSSTASSLPTTTASTIPSSQTSAISRYRNKRVAALLTVAGFVLTSLALWPTFASQKDGHQALSLSEWTSPKDFIEYCEDSVWTLFSVLDQEGKNPKLISDRIILLETQNAAVQSMRPYQLHQDSGSILVIL